MAQTTQGHSAANVVMLAAKQELLQAICPELKCAYCDGIPRPGETLWYQCLKGHFVCLNCRKEARKKFVLGLPSINRVCKCGSIVTSRPNEIVGKLINTLPFQCLFVKNECPEVLFAEAIPDHERNCQYRDLTCFICKTTVPLIKFEDHLETTHADCKSNFNAVSNNTFKCRESPQNNDDQLQIWGKLQNETGQIFFEIGVQHGELLQRWVYFFGTKEEAEKYYYVAHLNANCGEVMSYQGLVRSVDENFDGIIEDQSTFNVGVKTGKRLFVNQNMEYTLTIRRKIQEQIHNASDEVDRQIVPYNRNVDQQCDQESFNFEIQEISDGSSL